MDWSQLASALARPLSGAGAHGAASRTITGFYYAALQQQDVFGNWYSVSTV